MILGFHPDCNVQIQGTTGIGGNFIFSCSDVGSGNDDDPGTPGDPGAAPNPIGCRIQFTEAAEATERWIQTEIAKHGQRVSWHPIYGMTGTIIALPSIDMFGLGPKVRWDDGHVSWLGAAQPFRFISDGTASEACPGGRVPF